MKRFNHKRVSGVCLAMLLALVPLCIPVHADELQDNESKLQNVQKEIENQSSKVDHLNGQVKSVASQLKDMELSLRIAEKELQVLESQLNASQQTMDSTQKILTVVESKLGERNKIFHKRIRDIYENGQINYLEVLIGAKDFSDFTGRLELLKRVISSDLNLIRQIDEEKALVAQKKTELEQQRAVILKTKQQAEDKKKAVEDTRNQRKQLLTKLETERDLAESAYRDLMQTSREIEQRIRNLQYGSGRDIPPGTSSGRMMWPASGPITSPYGWRVHPIFGTSRYHSGIDIGADYGDAIAAADGGVVIAAEWMSGYGYAVMIQHSGGLTSLYGHCSQLVVSEGQVVRKGQTIAYVGSTGYSTGPHLHFEVRQNGSPVDPRGYL